jgi:riboflavin kinase/FMN adenylyltransferase
VDAVTVKTSTRTPAAGVAPVPRVVTIGTFDGVHLGHQYLLRRTAERGRELGLETVAVTFEPLPPQVLRPDRFPGRLCTVEEKYDHLAQAGLDEIISIRFSIELAAQSPETFMADLAATHRLRELWVGEDFALGRQRAGDVARLTEIGAELGFTVVALERLVKDGENVSSSTIRQAILTGDAGLALRLLGRPFRVSGEVIHGAHLGKTIGFPTANVAPPADLVPLADGIYASLAWLPDDTAPRPAMTYVGTRPTVNGGDRLVETNLLDFDGDLYGQILRVDVIERLRGDAVFASLDELVAQLRRDDAHARVVLTELGVRGLRPVASEVPG